jgi:hypothetical protein
VSRIFLGHSSANEAEAIAVHDWLIEQGWNDLFLDLDPERGIKAGQRWQEELKRAAERCEVVIFLISPAWAASKWCLAEFLLAKQLNKPIFGVIVEPTRIPTEMTAEWQLVDLTAGVRDHAVTVTLPRGAGTATGAFASEGLARLRIGLMQTGPDPTFCLACSRRCMRLRHLEPFLVRICRSTIEQVFQICSGCRQEQAHSRRCRQARRE